MQDLPSVIRSPYMCLHPNRQKGMSAQYCERTSEEGRIPGMQEFLRPELSHLPQIVLASSQGKDRHEELFPRALLDGIVVVAKKLYPMDCPAYWLKRGLYLQPFPGMTKQYLGELTREQMVLK